MMKPAAIISTDWHIRPDNAELSLDLAAQQIRLAEESDVKLLICLGDVFDSRKAQPEIVLNTFSQILTMIQQAGMKLICIPGNHDKTDPCSESSYLTPFKEWDCLYLVESWDANIGLEDYEDIFIGFIPYFREDVWLDHFNEMKAQADASGCISRYLFTHMAVNGSVNNDGSRIESRISAKLLKGFDKVFLGHYHNYQQPLSNAYHLAAWKQSNFGEDEDKGFYILEAEGTRLDIEFRHSMSPRYVTYEIDAEELTAKAAREILSEAEKASGLCKVRMSVRGDMSSIKGSAVKMLEDGGIKIKRDISSQKIEVHEVKDYRKRDAMIEAFREFCEEKGYDFEEGIEILEKAYE